MSDGHITLDRTNLFRLVDVLDEVHRTKVEPQATPEIAIGYKLAIDAVRAIAADMPHLYGDGGMPVATGHST